jgi:ABC-type sugar transport system ATPase subunit
MASVTIRRLSKVFEGGVQALHHLDLEVRDGELMVLLGPSGSGKTTVLRCIAGLEEPTTGEVVIGERVVTQLPPAQRDVAMVFQTPALYPHLTVRDNIAFPLDVRHVAAAQVTRRVVEAATKLGLKDVLDRMPAQLSEGERQRVALGRAIVRGPQAFLLDEPLSRLDAKLRIELRAELLALHRGLGATMIYVTHDQTEAMTIGQRIAVLHEGRLRQVGTPEEVYQRPADVHVARCV